MRKVNFGHNLLLPPLQLEEFLIQTPLLLAHLLRILATHVKASKYSLSNHSQLAFLCFGSLTSPRSRRPAVEGPAGGDEGAALEDEAPGALGAKDDG